MPFPRQVLQGPTEPTNISYLGCLRANSSGAQLWPVTCSMAGIGAIWGSLDGIARNYHTGLGALRGSLSVGATTLSIMTLRDFVFAPAKVYLQHRVPAHFPLRLSNLDPREASPRLHNLPDMAMAGGTAGVLLGKALQRPHLGRAAFSLALVATAFQYIGNELYLQQIRYINYRNQQVLSRVPIVTIKHRIKDVGAGLLDRFLGLGIATKIPDEDYLLDQQVQLDMVLEEQVACENQLARLEAMYASMHSDEHN